MTSKLEEMAGQAGQDLDVPRVTRLCFLRSEGEEGRGWTEPSWKEGWGGFAVSGSSQWMSQKSRHAFMHCHVSYRSSLAYMYPSFSKSSQNRDFKNIHQDSYAIKNSWMSVHQAAKVRARSRSRSRGLDGRLCKLKIDEHPRKAAIKCWTSKDL